MDEPKYKPGKVAAAAGIPIETLRNWERADRALIKRDEPGWFTFRRALQVGIASALLDVGVRAEFAIAAAGAFTDVGEGPLPGRDAREPGELYDHGWTVLCIYPNGGSDVKQVKPNSPAIELFMPLGHTRGDLVTALNITFLVERFRKRLEE